MKKWILIVTLYFSFALVKGQYELQFGQLLKTVEFINPGYNAIQTDISGALIYSNQWNGFPGSPSTAGTSLHLPFAGHFGTGVLFIKESLGHRDLQTAALSLDAVVRIAQDAYLTCGVLGGYQLVDYHIEDATTSYLEAVSDIYNYNAPLVGAGLNFFYNKIHVGTSAYYQIAQGETETSNALTMYANLSYWIRLDSDWRLKAAALYKTHGNYAAIAEGGLFLLFKDLVWLGGSYRLNSSVIAMADLKITDFLRLGYSFTMNAGELASFTGNSHEIQLHFTIPNKKWQLFSE